MAGLVRGTLVLREPGRVFLAVIAALFLALGLFEAIWRPSYHRYVGVLAVLLFGGLLVVSFLTGVRCDQDGVVTLSVVGRRRRLAWADIDHFEPDLTGTRAPQIVAVLRSNRRVVVTGWSSVSRITPQQAADLLEEQRNKH